MTSRKELEMKIKLAEEIKKRKQRRKIYNDFYFKPNSPLSIEHYPKHREFFKLGALGIMVRLFIAGNRIGKTESGGLYETVLHAIGWYPSWWEGKRFADDKNLSIWVVSDSFKDSRDVIQKKLFYNDDGADFGTGLIPYENIIETRIMSGVSNCYDYVKVKRNGGGVATIYFKASSQGRKQFQGTIQDIILLDEEPPLDVYVECMLRLMNNPEAIMLLTFTPLQGMTELIQDFEKTKNDPTQSKASVIATWDDAPHLTEEDKAKMLALIPEYQRDARTKGLPQLGAGAVYRVAIDDFCVKPFAIPDSWKVFFGMDVGYNHTAVAVMALDPNTDTIYMFDEMHIKGMGAIDYAPKVKVKVGDFGGAVDPASMAHSQTDGQQVFEILRKYGLDIITADNTVEGGITIVDERLKTGRFKVFETCKDFFDEYKMYRRDEKHYGKIVKVNDHMMDAVRYAIVTGIYKGKAKSADAPRSARSYGSARGFFN